MVLHLNLNITKGVPKIRKNQFPALLTKVLMLTALLLSYFPAFSIAFLLALLSWRQEGFNRQKERAEPGPGDFGGGGERGGGQKGRWVQVRIRLPGHLFTICYNIRWKLHDKRLCLWEYYTIIGVLFAQFSEIRDFAPYLWKKGNIQWTEYWFTMIGRKNATEFNIFTKLTNTLGHLKSSFYCVCKLFLIVNSLETRFWRSPNYLYYKWLSVSFLCLCTL